MPNRIFELVFEPGMQMDGTKFSARSCIGGQWVRWQRGLPRKIGGYQQLIGSPNISRGTYLVNSSPNMNVYIGTQQDLRYFTIDQNGNLVNGFINRTPQFFAANPNYDWQFDLMFSTVANQDLLIAYAGQNLTSIDQTVESPIYYGNSLANTALTPTGITASGGIVVLPPFLFSFGTSGDVKISEANDPTTIFNEARVCATKIVAGFRTRGGNSSPAGLLFSLDSVLRVTQVGTNQIEFAFDTITDQSSILSARGIIEESSIFYWAGTDRFFLYNGVVQEIQNNKNLNWFFDNLNYNQRQKVWATKITKYGEIWWHFPFGNSLECNAAIIYNYRENTWYNSMQITRSDGYFDQTFPKPIWCDNTLGLDGNYDIWMHETGTDQLSINAGVQTATAIDSYLQTPFISQMAQGTDARVGLLPQGLDNWTELYRIEPDFIQSGNMNITVSTQQYANSAPVIGANNPYSFNSGTTKIDMREQGREMTLKIESNTVGGDYQMGRILVVARVGDERQ